ncbi:unnamed protein product [Moneuplotes crassus]|uniref:Uncharacterized protein n=1 Tax=Euplotes crassus TaxID=5936 RepID=A0AAD1Y5F3_EUPCR|nr:unnamed protein product [Moneuplotes crassus]
MEEDELFASDSGGNDSWDDAHFLDLSAQKSNRPYDDGFDLFEDNEEEDEDLKLFENELIQMDPEQAKVENLKTQLLENAKTEYQRKLEQEAKRVQEEENRVKFEFSRACLFLQLARAAKIAENNFYPHDENILAILVSILSNRTEDGPPLEELKPSQILTLFMSIYNYFCDKRMECDVRNPSVIVKNLLSQKHNSLNHIECLQMLNLLLEYCGYTTRYLIPIETKSLEDMEFIKVSSKLGGNKRVYNNSNLGFTGANNPRKRKLNYSKMTKINTKKQKRNACEPRIIREVNQSQEIESAILRLDKFTFNGNSSKEESLHECKEPDSSSKRRSDDSPSKRMKTIFPSKISTQSDDSQSSQGDFGIKPKRWKFNRTKKRSGQISKQNYQSQANSSISTTEESVKIKSTRNTKNISEASELESPSFIGFLDSSSDEECLGKKNYKIKHPIFKNYVGLEVYNKDTKRWYLADLANETVIDSKLFVARYLETTRTFILFASGSYPLMFRHNDNELKRMVYIRDVTMKYTSYTRQVLITKSMFSLGRLLNNFVETFTPFVEKYCTNLTLVEAIQQENEEIERIELSVIPETYAEYRRHPQFVLKSQLTFEVLKPNAVPYKDLKFTVETERGKETENVYLKSDTILVHTTAKWNELGRRVRKGSIPLKYAEFYGNDKSKKARYYSVHQTVELVYEVQPDGSLPRNDYNDIEIFNEKRIPKGTTWLKDIPRIKYNCRKNGIEFVEVVVGFESHGHQSFPVKNGVIVHERDAERVKAIAKVKEKERQIRLEKKKRYLCKNTWKTLIRRVCAKRQAQLLFDREPEGRVNDFPAVFK